MIRFPSRFSFVFLAPSYPEFQTFWHKCLLQWQFMPWPWPSAKADFRGPRTLMQKTYMINLYEYYILCRQWLAHVSSLPSQNLSWKPFSSNDQCISYKINSHAVFISFLSKAVIEASLVLYERNIRHCNVEMMTSSWHHHHNFNFWISLISLMICLHTYSFADLSNFSSSSVVSFLSNLARINCF